MSLRRHITYANVTATLALVFAMGGSAIAANHYLITSTKQIKPSILKSLRGKVGATGATGATGAIGAPGATGKEGAPGLSALANLPSGASESGSFALGAEIPKSGGFVEGAISFPVPLAEAIPSANVELEEPGETSAHCSGPGHAARGFLCVYEVERAEIASVSFYSTEVAKAHGAGRNGTDIDAASSGTGPYMDGTWTVTAP